MESRSGPEIIQALISQLLNLCITGMINHVLISNTFLLLNYSRFLFSIFTETSLQSFVDVVFNRRQNILALSTFTFDDSAQAQ